MWAASTEKINPQAIRTIVSVNARPLSFGQVVDLWCGNSEFRCYYTSLVSNCQFEAFFWETPPITTDTLSRPFEFVVVESASLARLTPDPSPFASKFAAQKGKEILTFPNLGGDAILIVPAPIANYSCYTHLACFLRNAPRSQADALWAWAGEGVRSQISERPTWLSTAGLGVSWLHLRLDSRPKYYRFEPYTKES